MHQEDDFKFHFFSPMPVPDTRYFAAQQRFVIFGVTEMLSPPKFLIETRMQRLQRETIGETT